jgi:hypothetical protein
MTSPFPQGDRSIPPDDKGFRGMIQIEVDGRHFQICADSPEAREVLERHAREVCDG